MNDAEYEAQKARVLGLLTKWKEDIGLRQWSMTVNYHRGPYEVDGVLSSDHLASVKTVWPYQTFVVGVNLEAAANHSDDDLEECVIHELVHVLVNQMRGKTCCFDQDNEERVATMVTNAIWWARDTGREEGNA